MAKPPTAAASRELAELMVVEGDLCDAGIDVLAALLLESEPPVKPIVGHEEELPKSEG